MEFVCRIGTAEGRVVEEVRQASSEEVVRIELERQGFHVFRITRRGLLAGFALPSFGRRPKRIPSRDLQIFNQELAALLRAGLPVLQSLELMLERQRDPLFRDILTEVRRQVRDGEELSSAFGSFDDLLPPLYAATLKAGEQSGELEPVLRRFVRYQKLVGDARRRVVSALVYPAVLIGLSAILIGVMTIYVVPRFREFFEALNTQLPLVTRMTLAVSAFLSAYWVPVLIGLLVAAVIGRQLARSRAGRLVFDRWKLLVPLVGSVFRRLAVAEFCRSLATLLAGGIPVVPALENAVGAVGNAHIRSRLVPMVSDIREGVALHQALESSQVSPDIVIEMAKVGEETGSLDVMLGNAADFLDEEIETRMQRILTLVEPIMLVLMGMIVATLLIAVYLPLFSMLGQVSPR